MAGLVGYRSSDEEDSVIEDRREQPQSQILRPSALSARGDQRPQSNPKKEPLVPPRKDEVAQQGEAHSGSTSQTMTPESSARHRPYSPYVNHCATIRSLTLPSMPNLNIPQSPPGSPTSDADQKLSHFLGLKKQGIHFNTKLALSSALKNPSLIPRLMDFAGVGSERQYTTTLPTELWDTARFPNWAYKEDLAEAQHISVREKEEERLRHKHEGIDFVTAGI